MKRLILLIFGIVCFTFLDAQDFYFTDFGSSFSRINPALTAAKNKRAISFHFRNNKFEPRDAANKYNLIFANTEVRFSINKNHHFGFGINSLITDFDAFGNKIKEKGGAFAYHVSGVDKTGELFSRFSIGLNYGKNRHLFVNSNMRNNDNFNVLTGKIPKGQLISWHNLGYGIHQHFRLSNRNTLDFGYSLNHSNEPLVFDHTNQRLQKAQVLSASANIAITPLWDFNYLYNNTLQAEVTDHYYRLALRYQISDTQPYYMEFGVLTKKIRSIPWNPFSIRDFDLLGATVGVVLKNIRCHLTFEPVLTNITANNFELSFSYFKN